MSPEEYAKYMKSYNRGKFDAEADNRYEVVHEASNVEKQGYADGYMNAMDKIDPRG